MCGEAGWSPVEEDLYVAGGLCMAEMRSWRSLPAWRQAPPVDRETGYTVGTGTDRVRAVHRWLMEAGESVSMGVLVMPPAEERDRFVYLGLASRGATAAEAGRSLRRAQAELGEALQRWGWWSDPVGPGQVPAPTLWARLAGDGHPALSVPPEYGERLSLVRLGSGFITADLETRSFDVPLSFWMQGGRASRWSAIIRRKLASQAMTQITRRWEWNAQWDGHQDVQELEASLVDLGAMQVRMQVHAESVPGPLVRMAWEETFSRGLCLPVQLGEEPEAVALGPDRAIGLMGLFGMGRGTEVERPDWPTWQRHKPSPPDEYDWEDDPEELGREDEWVSEHDEDDDEHTTGTTVPMED